MYRQVFILTLVLLFCLNAFSQGISDTVFELQTVEIKIDRSFDKSEAGMKESKIDTLILMQKLNQSLGELLSENTSVFIKSNGRGALSSASFRGTAASHTQVSWNGININSPMAGMVDFSLIPVCLLDEVSLKHGTASISESSGGLGGTVNISNHLNQGSLPFVKYIQGIGSYSSFDEFLQFGLGNSIFRGRTSLYHTYSANDYTFINRGAPEIDPQNGEIVFPVDTNRNADYTIYGFMQDLYFDPDPKNRFSAKWWWQKAERSIPQAGSYEGPVNANLNDQSDRDIRMVVDWQHYGEMSKLLLRSGYADKTLIYILKNPVFGHGTQTSIYSRSSQKSLYNTIAYSREINSSFTINSEADFELHDVVSRDTVSGSGYAKRRSELSWLLSMQKNLNDRLNIKLMIRQDMADWDDYHFIPYLGFDYRILKEQNLILKGNIARNYHRPDLNALYWQPGGNPKLKSEEGFGFELGLEDQFFIKNHLIKAELTAFRNDINNWIIWIPGFKGYWEPHNIKRVLSQGIEVSLNAGGKIGRVEYRVSGNYAYTSSVNYGNPLVWGDDSYGKQLVYVPLHSGNFLFNIAWKKFYFTWQHNSYSKRFTTSSNDISSRNYIYPYIMNDLIIGKEFSIKKLKLTAEFKIYNLFDETYHSVLYRPMPGRNYLLLLMFKI